MSHEVWDHVKHPSPFSQKQFYCFIRKEIFYLTMHSTHFIYGYMASDISVHSDSKRENLLSPHRLLFLISSKFFYMHHSTDRITHTTTFVTPVVEHWLEWEIAQWVHHEGSIRRPIAPWENALTMTVSLDASYSIFILSWLKHTHTHPSTHTPTGPHHFQTRAKPILWMLTGHTNNIFNFKLSCSSQVEPCYTQFDTHLSPACYASTMRYQNE